MVIIMDISSDNETDIGNYFFENLFIESERKFIAKYYVRCGEYLETNWVKNVHNFVKHYAEVKHIPFDDRAVTKQMFGGILNSKISYKEHQEFHDFHNTDELIENFLVNVKQQVQDYR